MQQRGGDKKKWKSAIVIEKKEKKNPQMRSIEEGKNKKAKEIIQARRKGITTQRMVACTLGTVMATEQIIARR